MNKTDWQNLNVLWSKKEEYLKKVLKMTKERSFSVVEEDVERIYNFFNKREALFTLIYSIESKIKKFNLTADDKKSLFYKDVEEHIKNVDSTAREIIELDKKNRIVMDELIEHIRVNIRDIKVRQKVQRGYQDYYSTELVRSSFDSKQ